MHRAARAINERVLRRLVEATTQSGHSHTASARSAGSLFSVAAEFRMASHAPGNALDMPSAK
jgi:hypothetical protein